MILRKPKEKDINDLIKLSKLFKDEYKWTDQVPIANINTVNKAKERLFNNDIKYILIAEIDNKMVGYLAVRKYTVNNKIGYEASILIHPDFRRQGIAKKLIKNVFNKIPKNIKVEAWILDDNIQSKNTAEALGFKYNRTFKEDKNVKIYTKNGNLEGY